MSKTQCFTEWAESPFIRTVFIMDMIDVLVPLCLPSLTHSLPFFALLCISEESPCPWTSRWTWWDGMVRGVWVFALTLHSNPHLPIGPSRSLDTSLDLSFPICVKGEYLWGGLQGLFHGFTSWRFRKNSYSHWPNQITSSFQADISSLWSGCFLSKRDQNNRKGSFPFIFISFPIKCLLWTDSFLPSNCRLALSKYQTNSYGGL